MKLAEPWELLEEFMAYFVPEHEIKTREIVLNVPESGIRLGGTLRTPPAPLGWIIFAHGSGSSRFSPRNIQVAKSLNPRHFATLLFDLLSPEEFQNRKNVFDISLLTERLILAQRWIKSRLEYNGAPIAFFGASTGAAAALKAAAILGKEVGAVVSRGGRVDLARTWAPEVPCETLLIVGGWDEPVLTWNRETLPLLKKGSLKVIPEATHLFEEPGALNSVIASAGSFFEEHLRGPEPSQAPAPRPSSIPFP